MQLSAVERKLSGFKTKRLADAAILVAGLMGSVASGGWSLAAAAPMASNRGPSSERERERTRPSFFGNQELEAAKMVLEGVGTERHGHLRT